MGQWEFQIGPLGPVEASDEIWLARWLLYRIGEDFDDLGHAQSQAHPGRLERSRRSHQLLHQGDA